MPDSDDLEFTINRSEKIGIFEIAFQNYWEQLYRHAYRKTQSPDLSKDLVQEVYITWWHKINDFNSNDEVLPYLYAILRNKILKQYQQSAVHLRYAISVSGKENPTEPASHSILLSKELQSLVDQEVHKMPDKMRQIYLLKKEEGISIREIAQKLGISEQTVKNQLQSAYKRLRMQLKDYDSPLMVVGLVLHFAPILTHH
jgi:RNA polymerase sigma-70 factor (ECF subfamily)